MDIDFQNSLKFGILAMLLVALWYYRKCMRLYAEFNTISAFNFMTEIYVLRRKPKDVPVLSYIFQRMIKISKELEHLGMCFVWTPWPTLFIWSEEAVKIFSKEQACVDKSNHYIPLKDLLGNGLLTSSGEKWRKHRKMLNPVFNLGMLKGTMAVFNENAEKLVKNLSEVTKKSHVDLLDYLKVCSFGNLCESLIGLKANKEENKEIVTKYVERISELFLASSYRVCHPWFTFKTLLYLTSSGRKYLKLYEENDNFTKKIIADIKESVVSRNSTECDSVAHEYNRKSFTYILMKNHLKDPSFTLKDLQDQVTTFMAAGFDTVAVTSMWCLFMLGHHADVQEHAYNEVITETGSFIMYEDACKLQYLECVIKETLRLFPTVPVLGRHLTKDVQCGKHKIPKNTSVAFFPYRLHRNAQMYPDPESFKPERFLPGKCDNPPWVHIPFSEGIRYCIGKQFALLEMKVILAYILRHYEITSLDKKENIQLSWDGILAPSKPLRMHLKPRESL